MQPGSVSSQRYLLEILERRLLPWVTRDGTDRLVCTAATLDAFRAQGLPAEIQVSIKKRTGKKIISRGPRHHGNVSVRLAHWPEDNQDVLRYPTLACVLKGRADFHVADYVIHCPEGHFVLFKAGLPSPGNISNRPHFEGDTTGRICDIAWISPRMGYEKGLAFWTCHSAGNTHSNTLLSNPAQIYYAELATLFNLFVQSLEEPMDNSGHITTQTFQLSFGLLHYGLKNNALLHVDGAAKTNPHSFQTVQQYIQEHLHQPLTIDQVAHSLFMSRSNFTRQFRQCIGQSFHQYLSEQRLQRAKVLLEESNWSIKTIANSVGLKADQLRNLFARHEKLSPSAYRDHTHPPK